MNPLLLQLPHDSAAIPAADLADFLVTSEFLRREQLLLTDWHTAALYADGCSPQDFVRASGRSLTRQAGMSAIARRYRTRRTAMLWF
jgi:hypothetical protein